MVRAVGAGGECDGCHSWGDAPGWYESGLWPCRYAPIRSLVIPEEFCLIPWQTLLANTSGQAGKKELQTDQ